MLRMIDIQTVSIAIASAGVFLAAIYYILQLRHQARMRQTDLVVRISSDMKNREFLEATLDVTGAEYKDYDDFAKKYGTPLSKNQVPLSFLMVGNYFEQIGVLFRNKLIDANLIGQLVSCSYMWEKMEPYVKSVRKELQDQSYYEWFEYLYNELKKREQQASKTA